MAFFMGFLFGLGNKRDIGRFSSIVGTIVIGRFFCGDDWSSSY